MAGAGVEGRPAESGVAKVAGHGRLERVGRHVLREQRPALVTRFEGAVDEEVRHALARVWIASTGTTGPTVAGSPSAGMTRVRSART